MTIVEGLLHQNKIFNMITMLLVGKVIVRVLLQTSNLTYPTQKVTEQHKETVQYSILKRWPHADLRHR